MFENKHLSLIAGLLTWFSVSATQAADLALEPCINGDVSPSGTFPTAQMEREINAYHNWPSYAPYYLFAVSANYLESPFDQTSPDQGVRDIDGSSTPAPSLRQVN